MLKVKLSALFIVLSCMSYAQDKQIDPDVKKVLDSLDSRIAVLEGIVNGATGNRDANYFHSKRELNMTKFVREYEELIYDENLDLAKKIIEKHKAAAEKRHDNFARDYYKKYITKLARLRAQKQRHYSKILEKENTFKKEYDRYTKNIDEYTLARALRMVELAVKYAEEKRRKDALVYLIKYRDFTEALIYDYSSPYDLKELTNNISKFEKIYEPMLDSDSLEIIQSAGELVSECEKYASSAKSKIPSDYFKKQKIAIANAIADWNARQGISKELGSLTGEAALMASFEGLNKPGIYRWRNLITVIGSTSFSSKSEMVRRGEVIHAADKMLFNYIRINRIVKLTPKTTSTSGTFILPYNDNGKKAYYKLDPSKGIYQFMVCYQLVVNEKVTEDLNQFLSPLQFKEEME